jgi:lipopolysaccharide biosynthesis glycosyltransferase
MNNYKILDINNDNQKKYKFNNLSLNYNNNDGFAVKLNLIFIKLLFILLLTLFKFKDYELEDFDKDIKDELEQNNILNFLKSHDFWNYTCVKNEMHYYSLYNQFKFPKLSLIIIMNKISENDISEFINSIQNKTSSYSIYFEIIIYFPNKKRKDDIYQITKNYKNLMKQKKLKVFEGKNDNISDFSNIINIIKSHYTIFLNNTKLLKNLELDKVINQTNDMIENCFKMNFSNSLYAYLIKSKLLKDLIDEGFEFNSFENLFSKIISLPDTTLNYIHISLCPDNNFTKLAYVTMISILSTKSINTYVCFYLIIPKNYENKNIIFLETLHEDYIYFNITFIKMDDRYDKAYTDSRITQQAYYRFSLGELLPNLNKIIYFDTDIIVYKDLYNFYNLNFNGKMILGYPTYGNGVAQRKGYHRINTGVLLLNLCEIRKKKFEKDVIKIIEKKRKLSYHDQTLLNDYFKQYLGIFPPEYHARPWSNYKEMKIFNKKVGNVFDIDYFYFMHKYPAIRHYLGGYKPINPYINHIEDWWFYARKSKYFNDKAKKYYYAFSF